MSTRVHSPVAGDQLWRVVPDPETEWQLIARTIVRESPTLYFLDRPFPLSADGKRVAKALLGYTVHATPEGALGEHRREQGARLHEAERMRQRAERGIAWALVEGKAIETGRFR